jgi:hypothetical protein
MEEMASGLRPYRWYAKKPRLESGAETIPGSTQQHSPRFSPAPGTHSLSQFPEVLSSIPGRVTWRYLGVGPCGYKCVCVRCGGGGEGCSGDSTHAGVRKTEIL